ncbi:MAG: Rrf2 family transcriptional regulator [bacterium]|nr:Rrf2 family transcriptional regulator [bacterium]
MQIFSKRAEYAIRALLRALLDGPDRRFAAKDICAEADIPEAFARKGFQQLVRSGILEASPGRGGGYLLAHPPSEVSLLQIASAMDGEEQFHTCPIGMLCTQSLESPDFANPCCDENCDRCNERCGFDGMCPLHDVWHSLRSVVLPKLAQTTLADIVSMRTTEEESKEES